MAQGQESRQRTGHGLAVHPGYAMYNALNCVSGYSADWTSPGQAARMVQLARGRSRLGGCPPSAGGVGGAGLGRGLVTSWW